MTNKPWWLLALLPSLVSAQSLPAPLDETTGTAIAPPVAAPRARRYDERRVMAGFYCPKCLKTAPVQKMCCGRPMKRG